MRKALLLAAGFGTRLLPLTKDTPKCLIEVGNRTLLGRWIEEMENCGVDEILVNTHYLSERVEKYLQKNYKDRVSIMHEVKLLGTGGTVKRVINEGISDELVIVHVDNYIGGSCAGLFEAYNARPEGCKGTLLLFQTDKPTSCGIVQIGENGVITRYEEKPKEPSGNLANGAVCILSASAQQLLQGMDHIEDFARDFLPRMAGSLNGWLVDQYYDDIGTWQSLKKLRSMMAESVRGK